MIKLFTGPSCSACKALKGRLDKMGLTEYEECDIADDTHKDSLLALGFRSIPALVKYGDTGDVVDSLGGNLHSDATYIELFKGVLV
jgi:glutaredoxin